MTTPTLVLIHGVMHGPWCFDLLRQPLSDRGISTIAPELPLETLAGDVAVVRDALDALDGPAVLLGHSYGGTVITWAGEHPSVRSLVYLTAGVPDIGEGVGSGPTTTTTRPPPEGIRRSTAGVLSVEPAAAVRLFYPDAEPALAAAWAAKLRPSRSREGEVVPCAAWRTRPVDYIVCRDDSILPEATQRWLAERANANVHELPGDHSPLLARPDALVEILAQIVPRNAV